MFLKETFNFIYNINWIFIKFNIKLYLNYTIAIDSNNWRKNFFKKII